MWCDSYEYKFPICEPVKSNFDCVSNGGNFLCLSTVSMALEIGTSSLNAINSISVSSVNALSQSEPDATDEMMK